MLYSNLALITEDKEGEWNQNDSSHYGTVFLLAFWYL